MLGLTLGVILYIILYYILSYTIIISYTILFSSHLPYSSSLSHLLSSNPFLSSSPYSFCSYLLFQSSSPPLIPIIPFFPSSFPYSFYTCRELQILIYTLSVFLNHPHLPHSPLSLNHPNYLFLPIPSQYPFQYSFYTCRELHILIYILSFLSSSNILFPPYPNNLTPHVLSEVCLEWCGKYLCGVRFWDVLCSELV